MNRLSVFSEKLGNSLALDAGLVGGDIHLQEDNRFFAWTNNGWANTSDNWLNNGWNNYRDTWMNEGWNNSGGK